ncbi:Nucleoside-diphosphate-sugar epimerase [Microlunatus sagamiharensis]|uniref:Nucleoside-diphosphate-sugar epimerase n=1 Tax=Microlunatus sagamiharensis TaxID=546874 RepID=A0A1H2M6H2_9ACTN|nr:NAD-dependent epimerase/dehydratase family protein [Microlunatus sagamiharensis]SDU88615.1 Nucleoside-diphosphate-sugar epimerase [Microlunatus sagamiharensis]
MRVLVTGASGMLGGAVARALAERGDEVTVLQRRPSGLGFREVLGDVADATAVREAVAGQEGVVHLAAKVNVVGLEADYVRTNVVGTRNVLEACTASGVGRLVQVSSPSVAHAGSSLVGAPAGPADPATARGPYARTKAQSELEALAADGTGEVPLAVVAVRPHIVWGPGDTQLVERIVERGRAGRLPLLGTGAPLIDTTYVDNAADALVAALDRAPEVHGEAFVVSNGEPRPVGEIFGDFCAAAGVDRPTRHVPARLAVAAGDVVERLWSLRHRDGTGQPPMTRFLAEQLSTAHWFDQRRTREALRWTPSVSIAEGLERLAASFGRR